MNTSKFPYLLICSCFFAITLSNSNPVLSQEFISAGERWTGGVRMGQYQALRLRTDVVTPIATYDPSAGDVFVAYPNMFWIEVRSNSGLFNGERLPGFDGLFDRQTAESIFKFDIGMDEIYLPGVLPAGMENPSSEISIFIAPEIWGGLESFIVADVMILPEAVPSASFLGIAMVLWSALRRPTVSGSATAQ